MPKRLPPPDMRKEPRRFEAGQNRGGSALHARWKAEEDETLRLLFAALVADMAPRTPGAIVKRLAYAIEEAKDQGRSYPDDRSS